MVVLNSLSLPAADDNLSTPSENRVAAAGQKGTSKEPSLGVKKKRHKRKKKKDHPVADLTNTQGGVKEEGVVCQKVNNKESSQNASKKDHKTRKGKREQPVVDDSSPGGKGNGAVGKKGKNKEPSQGGRKKNRYNMRKGKQGQEAKKPNLKPFHGFFEDGSVSSSLFIGEDGIRSYLSVQDLVCCARTGHHMHSMCRTYTVQELLREKPLTLKKEHRTELGSKVMARVLRYSPGTEPKRPTRLIINFPTEVFRAKLYHPQELDQVHRLIDGFLAIYGAPRDVQEAVPKKQHPMLVSAFFGPLGQAQKSNVTHRIRDLVRAQGGSYLILTAPPSKYRIRWWYTRIFGDPCPYTTKSLVITTRDPRTGRVRRHEFHENEVIRMGLSVDHSTCYAKTSNKRSTGKRREKKTKNSDEQFALDGEYW